VTTRKEVWFTKEAIGRLVAGADERRQASGLGSDTREAIQARIDEARARLTSA
jgi:hypothetical protein